VVDCHWLSHPDAIDRARYKMEQLSRAARLGFTVPRTLVSNDPTRVREFLDECPDGAVYKVLTDPFLRLGPYLDRVPDAEVTPVAVMTTRVDEGMRAALDSVRGVPCQFQEFVPKYSELRVTVIDGELFCAEVRWPEAAPVDWRVGGPDVDWRVAKLPEDVASRCLALVSSYGLAFGAIDLIRTPDGRYVFLEINPTGQFLFVQDKVPSLRMDEAVAASLIRGRADAA
jgi:glutathione synthase/RimK-type ligase-like ATP-grasp enzyme